MLRKYVILISCEQNKLRVKKRGPIATFLSVLLSIAAIKKKKTAFCDPTKCNVILYHADLMLT